jgi:phosphoglycolate phosphatase-like HAD superfamily hydrolase
MLKMIVLDFDGTTADTMPTLEKTAVRLIAENYGVNPEEARKKYRQTTGLPFVQQMELIFPHNDLNDKVVAQFEREKLENIFDLPLFPDAKETINFLQNNGFLVAISSSTIQPTIEEYCKQKNLVVEEILGYREGFEKGKDHFDFLKEKFSLQAEEMVYVGDSLKDCERAQMSDVLFIGKKGMFSKEQFNALSNSKLVINHLSELKELILIINEKKKKNV